MWTTPVDNLEWAPAPGLVAVAWVVTAAAAVWTAATWLTSADPAGGLIAAVAPVGAGLAALFGTRARPRLTVAADGTERLYVFGRLDLAADPEDVAPRLASVRP